MREGEERASRTIENLEGRRGTRLEEMVNGDFGASSQSCSR